MYLCKNREKLFFSSMNIEKNMFARKFLEVVAFLLLQIH